MRKFSLFVLMMLLLPTLDFSQATTGFHRTNQVLSRAQGGVAAQVVPYATVVVTKSSDGTAATIYSDPQLTAPISPPVVSADENGNYGYYIPLGYCVNETISSLGQGSVQITNICQNAIAGSGTVLPGVTYKLPTYNSAGTTVVGPSNITTDSSGNSLNIPGTLTGVGASFSGNLTAGGTVTAGSLSASGTVSANTLNTTYATFAGGPYLDITSPIYGGICDGNPHVVSGTDINVQAVQLASVLWLQGGYTLGSPTGKDCVFTQLVQLAYTATVKRPPIIDTHGGTWHFQAGGTPIARFDVESKGTYSVCPTTVNVNGVALSGSAVTITCTGSSPNIKVSTVILTNPNTGTTYNTIPTVTLTGGTGTDASVIAVMSGAFNITVTNPSNVAINMKGLSVIHSNFVEDGYTYPSTGPATDGQSSPVLVNFDGGAHSKTFFSDISIIDSAFTVSNHTTTAFQTISTFQSKVYGSRFLGTAPSSASIGYYGFSILDGTGGQASGEWTLTANDYFNFDHGIYSEGGDIVVNGGQSIDNWEEGAYFTSHTAVNALHVEGNWYTNNAGLTTQAGLYCAPACDLRSITANTGASSFQNAAILLNSTPSTNSSTINGGFWFQNGLVGYTYLNLEGPGNVSVQGIPLNSSGTQDYTVVQGFPVIVDPSLAPELPLGTTTTSGSIPNFGSTNGQFNSTPYSASNPIPASIAPGTATTATGTWYEYGSSTTTASTLVFVQNQSVGFAFPVRAIQASTSIQYRVSTADNTANLYDLAIYNAAGTLQCHLGATAGTTFAPATGLQHVSWTGGTCTLAPGTYILTGTTNCAATCAVLSQIGSNLVYQFLSTAGMGATTGGVAASTVTPPASTWSTGATQWYFVLRP